MKVLRAPKSFAATMGVFDTVFRPLRDDDDDAVTAAAARAYQIRVDRGMTGVAEVQLSAS
jgi:hypothetical protein